MKDINTPGFLSFELSGPVCGIKECSGVLIYNIDLNTKKSFYRCSECKTEFDRQSELYKKQKETLELLISLLIIIL
jgi:hypothetical protein